MVRWQLVVVGEIKTLILGAGGLLGHELQGAFPEATGLMHRDLNIADNGQVLRMIKELRPQTVINAAAYTAVDDCEDRQELAYGVNGQGPGYVAEACAAVGATLVHFSTDYVFDGSGKEYAEADETGPVNVYGASKLMGEQYIARRMKDFRIIRTSWLFGAHGRNFVDTMLQLSGRTEKVRVVNDQFGKPTYAADLAHKVRDIIDLPPGIYHVTNDGICSWYEFASAIIRNAVPCSSEEFPQRARRPGCSALISTKTAPLRHWRAALSEYLGRKGDLS
jgi:dTDP-4-dehydrorhamnose reductase